MKAPNLSKRVHSVAGGAGLLLLVLLGSGCAGEREQGVVATTGDPTAAVRSTSSEPVVDANESPWTRPSSDEESDWVDPEPPEAQALAESVVDEPWNNDRVVPIALPATSRLSMKMSRLVDRRTGIDGFHSTIDGDKISIDERLARLDAEVSDLEIVITLAGAVLFDFDRHEIRPDAERMLEDVVEILQDTAPRATRVEGHTDSIGTDAYNRRLSERRADSVREWLIGHGVADTRLRIRGFGEEKPIATNESADGRQQNRRVEIVIERS